MKKKLIPALALVALAATSNQTLWASTQLGRIFSAAQADKTKSDEVRDASKETSAVWPSTFPGETQQFEGYFIATSGQTKLAVRSDDGVSISKDGSSILGNVGTGQHWPNDASYFDLGGGWTQNVPYKVVVDYKNTAFSGNDADGVSLMNYTGTGKIVTVDLTVDGIGEDDEEKEGAFLGLNAPSATPGTVGSNTNLKDATLSLNGQGESGKWSLSFPSGIKVWQQNGGGWQPVTSGTESAAVTLPKTVSLKVEGATAGEHEITGSLKLTAPSASQSILDKAKATVVSVTIAKAPASFVPRGGDQDNEIELEAKVLPNTVKGKFRFTLFATSNEPGYCMNAPQTPPANGEDSMSWKDLQFPAQTGLTLTSNNSVAETTDDKLSQQTIKVKSYDYGAYGKLGVRLILANGTELVAKEEGGTRAYSNIPLDDNGNHIADSVGQNVGPGVSFDAANDNDNTPVGAVVDGDGISRYEEYRGFVVQGAHKRLSTLKKDVFFRNVNVTDAGDYGFFTEANLTSPTHSVRATEYIDATRVVNFNNSTAHVVDQQAIRITDGGTPPPTNPTWQGASLANGAFIPNNQVHCRVFVNFIKQGTAVDKIGGITETDISIPVNSTSGYRSSGTLRIGSEEINYTGITGNSFTGCSRGANGTTASAHADGTKVPYYANPSDTIQRTFAHEAGHLVELEHPNPDPGNTGNIMGHYWRGGTIANGGIATQFISPAYDAVAGEFRVN